MVGDVEPQNRREVRGLDPGVSPLALEGFDQTGFLAANVGTSTAMHVDLQIVASAQDVLAQETSRARLLEGRVEQLGRMGHLTADVDVGQLHVVGPAGDDHPLDQLVRILVEDLAVFERARLGLVGVANQIDRLAAAAIHEAPLEAGGKPRATATAQTRSLDVFAQRFLRAELLAIGQIPSRHGQGPLERLVAAMALVTPDIRREARLIEVLENQFERFRHGYA